MHHVMCIHQKQPSRQTLEGANVLVTKFNISKANFKYHWETALRDVARDDGHVGIVLFPLLYCP